MLENETNEILQRLTRVETKIDLMVNARDIAQEANLSAKNAHARLNKIDKIIFWAATTVIGGIVLGAIAILFTVKGA